MKLHTLDQLPHFCQNTKHQISNIKCKAKKLQIWDQIKCLIFVFSGSEFEISTP